MYSNVFVPSLSINSVDTTKCKSIQECFDIISKYVYNGYAFNAHKESLKLINKIVTKYKKSPFLGSNTEFNILLPKTLLLAVYHNKQEVVELVMRTFPKSCLDGNNKYWETIVRVAVLRQNISALLYMRSMVKHINTVAMRIAIKCKSDPFIHILAKVTKIARVTNIINEITVDDVIAAAKHSNYALIQLVTHYQQVDEHVKIIRQLRKLKMYESIAIFDKFSKYSSYNVKPEVAEVAETEVAEVAETEVAETEVAETEVAETEVAEIEDQFRHSEYSQLYALKNKHTINMQNHFKDYTNNITEVVKETSLKESESNKDVMPPLMESESESESEGSTIMYSNTATDNIELSGAIYANNIAHIALIIDVCNNKSEMLKFAMSHPSINLDIIKTIINKM